MKLVIGCGYLGQRVAAAWREAGHHVAALTRSPERAREFESHGWRPIVGDVLAPESLRALPDCDTLLWAVGLDRKSGHSQRDVYVTGLRNVLDAVRDRAQRVISISSTSVYGQTNGEWVDESSPCEPTRENGKVCLEAESLVLGRDSAATWTHTNVLRLSGIYGPGRLLRRVEDLKAGAPMTGNPDAWLNLIHVDDAARVVLACEGRGAPGAVYLISDNEPIRRRDYYEALARATATPLPRFAELDPGSPDARDFNKRCSNSRVRQELEVTLDFPTIEKGVVDSVRSL